MGIMANTVSIYQYQVTGDIPSNLEEWVQGCLQKNAFVPIDASPEEEAVGWVALDDQLDFGFENPNFFHRGDYFFFTLRRDRRRVPGPVLKNMLKQECDRWLEAHPNFNRVPSKRRTEIRENLYVSLLPRTLPVPATVDLVWNTATGIVTVASINNKVLDLVEDEFRQSFPGLSLVPIHPMARAERVVDPGLREALTRADQASTKDVLLQIKKNRWLGWDFLLWLLHRTGTSGSQYQINQAGPLDKGEVFFAYLHDGLLLTHEQETGIRKSHIVGPQDDFAEARKALMGGKNIEDGIISIEKDDRSWRMNLKGHIFAYASYKCPPVRIDKDVAGDPALEREAAFFERMVLLEEGLQILDSLLATFLAERLGKGWENTTRRIKQWLEA